MATSNSTNFTMTRDEIITDALLEIGVIGETETATTAMLTTASRQLNRMIKAWEAKEIHLWTQTEGTVFLRENVNTYTLINSGSGDHGSAGTVVETTLDGDASGTSIDVTSSTGMAVSDNIGIELDDGTRQWTTITVITNNTLTLNTALTGAASDNNTVFTYTTKLDRPLDIIGARVRNSANLDRPIFLMGRKEYMDMPKKDTSAIATGIYYDPSRDTGTLYVWPTPNNVADRLKISYIRAIQDFDASGDNADLPQEWLEAIVLNLAVKLSRSYGIDLTKQNPDLLQDAKEALFDLSLWDTENSSIKIVPNS